MKSLLSALCAGFLVVVSIADATAGKYTLDDLTKRQRERFYEKLEMYALISSTLDYCGRDPRWIDQVAREARLCIEPSTISQVVREYRGMHKKNLSEIRVPASKLCNKPELQGMIHKVKQMFARDFARAKAFCKSHQERP